MSLVKSNPTRFVSLRWRLILPTFLIVLVLTMISAYVVARSLPSSDDMSRVSMLFTTGRAVSDRADVLFKQQQTDADQLAQMPDVAAALNAPDELSAMLENYARRNDLDSAVAVSLQGQEIAGVVRDGSGTYGAADLQSIAPRMLFMSAPITLNGAAVGSVMVGRNYTTWLEDARSGAAAEIAFYQQQQLAATTVASLPSSLPEQYLTSAPGDSFQALQLHEAPYLGAYYPIGDSGAVVAVYVPDNAPFAAEAGQQLIALTLATVAAGIVITIFVMTNVFLDRINRVKVVAQALADGDYSVRTNMQPTDEIGALGRALDVYTDRVQQRHDTLRASLRRQRREIEHLNAVLESLPDGVIIEDLDGNVTFINEHAKKLIGEGHNFFKRMEMREITAAVTDTLGPAYAPGLYSLGTPQRMEMDGKMLRVQSFAVMSLADQRVGTVIMVRDVTVEYQREQARAALLDKMAENGLQAANPEMAVSQQIRRNIGALQKLIVEMREMVSSNDAQLVQQTARQLPLDTLIWAVANEWKQVAQAANLTMTVTIDQPGLQIVGDERRLRWAMGNIIDNAIKYTPPGGKISLEIKDEEDGYARLRVRDNGVGIAADELPNVFTRFYRGNPVSVTGRALRVPGTGQGLTIARQIIELHNGRIYLRSSPGVGTAVYFTLPMALYERGNLEYLDEVEAETVQMGRS
ncbi:MAG: HAMP domain-containing protein [Chloroflexi bacterium]|nr:HAMP domain-containing protein [Chloroflexota bacterium]